MGTDADQLKREIEATRSDLGGTLDAIGDRVSPSRMMERRKNRMMDGMYSLKNRVMGSASSAGHSVSDTAHDMTGTVKDLPSTVRHEAQGAPMMAGAIAFGVGFLAGVAFPPSEKERQIGETVRSEIEPIKDDLMSAGKEVVGNLETPAKEAVSGLVSES